LKLVPPTVDRALKEAGVSAGNINHLVMAAPVRDVAAAVARATSISSAAVANPLTENCGYAGAAHSLLMLAHVLEKAEPNQTILWVGFGQGCDALVFRVTDAIGSFQPLRGVSCALADMLVQRDYLRLLAYRGEIELEWGMRAERPIKTALSEQYRSSNQLLRFSAGKCAACGTVQFPQLPYCVNPSCNAPEAQFGQLPLYDEPARIFNFTTDWLSYHPAPPLLTSQIQFDNGAKLLMEIVDVGQGGVGIGTPVRMVFRIKDTDKARGYPRYFWKATPLAAA
jgi:uncharacterized OB-fold protein